MAQKIELDMDQLAALCRMKPTAEDCAAFFKCSVDTIERRIKEYTDTDEFPGGLTFAEFREQNMVQTRFDLVRMAISKAEKSDTMHIFCLKNLCNWRDKQKDENEVLLVNKYENMSNEDLEFELEKLMKSTMGDELYAKYRELMDKEKKLPFNLQERIEQLMAEGE